MRARVIRGLPLMASLIAQPGRHQLAQLAQQRARYVSGNPDADHAYNDLRIRAADVGIPDEEPEAAALGAAHRSGAAAAGNHFRRNHHGPGDPDADRRADGDRWQRTGKYDAAKDVPAR